MKIHVIPELIPVGSRCPYCPPLPEPTAISEDAPCSHVVHFTTEHGVRCGVVVGGE